MASGQHIRLHPGDLLYLPRGTAHSASARAAVVPSTHLSVSLFVEPYQTAEGALHQVTDAEVHLGQWDYRDFEP